MASVTEGPFPYDGDSSSSSSPDPEVAVLFVGISLVLGIASRHLLRGTRVPYTVALLVLGIGLGSLEYGTSHHLGKLGAGIRLWASINPSLLLSVFLPALLFESSFAMEVHQIKRCMVQMVFLAGPGVLISTVCLGAALKLSFPYSWNWKTSLLLGGLLSATDPVAVVALLKDLGASKKLSTIIEGESLMNDGTAIVVYQLFYRMVLGHSFNTTAVIKFLSQVSLGAVAVGLAFGMASVLWLGFIFNDTVIEIALTLAVSYIAYFTADKEAGVSGVLTVMTLGMFYAAFARTAFKGDSQQSLHHFWEMVAYIANTLIFILSGVFIAEGVLQGENHIGTQGASWGYLVLLYVYVQVSRFIVVGILYPCLQYFGYGLDWKEATILVWSGLRGAVALSLSLSVKVKFSTNINRMPIALLNDSTEAFTTYRLFDSREALVDWVREVGKENGFMIVIKSSEAGGGKNNRRPRMRFACERSGTYRKFVNKSFLGEEVKLRPDHTSTKKCGCPFELKAVRDVEGWTLTVMNGMHNHFSARNLEGHSYAGRLSSEEATILVEMSNSLSRPRDILNTLKNRDPSNASTMKCIYNARHKYRVVERAGRSQMQQLMKRLSEHKYVEWHRSDEETECVKDLFWAHPFGVELLRAFPRVLIMDCTYKTNRYKYPLLEIVGVTSTEMTFSAAFAFMECEKEENYTWVLQKLRSMMDDRSHPSIIVTDRELAIMNAIRAVFPHSKNLLCRWHIGKNILAKCKKMFDKEKWDEFNCHWHLLVRCSTAEKYEQRLSELEREFFMFPSALKYVKDNWLSNYKERFVGVWTEQVMHFGNLTTNRAESAHAKLKRHLASSQGTFDNAWEKMHRLVELQHTEIKASFEKSLGFVQHSFRHTLYSELRGFVSKNALEFVLREAQRAESIGVDVYACGCGIRRTHGLPCAHEIAEYKRDGRPIPLSAIHDHWKKLGLSAASEDPTVASIFHADIDDLVNKFYDMDESGKIHLMKKLKGLVHPAYTGLLPPDGKANVRGRKSEKIDKSTRRNKSAFEYTEFAEDIPSPLITCSDIPVTSTRRPKEEVRRTPKIAPTVFDHPLVSEFPIGLRQYIGVKNVEADGNCGFRAIAGLMGFGEDDWRRVRSDLIGELGRYEDEYAKMFVEDGRVKELHHSLSYFEAGRVDSSRWMTLPDMGHLIASCYNVVFVFISTLQCLTFLPLRSPPASSAERKIIAIGLVHGCHFVEVFLKPASPLPPIACKWYKHRYPCAHGWETPFPLQIQHFKELVGSDTATAEDVIEV